MYTANPRTVRVAIVYVDDAISFQVSENQTILFRQPYTARARTANHGPTFQVDVAGCAGT